MADWKSEYILLTRRLVQARAKLGLTQDQFTVILGVSRRSLQRYESGELDIPLRIAYRWADIAGISISARYGASNSPDEARTK